VYLARKNINGKIRYYIRESYPDGNCLHSRDLFDLGFNPDRYIIYPGGNAFYISDIVEDRLRDMGVTPDEADMDEIFWPFLRPDIRHAQDHFRGRSQKKKPRTAPVSADRFHLFDRRRVHYLRYGQMDQGRIGRVSPRLFQVLCDKSRDEIEQYFMASERVLRPHELKSYLFTAFNLQYHFSESFAKTMPQALDQNLVDEHFIRELCKLHGDAKFHEGMETGDRLNEYLVRYVILFFDNEYGQSAWLEDMIFEWMNRHRDHRPPRKKSFTFQEASTVFGVTEEALRNMSKKEISRLFRQKAQEFHPDKGGDPEKFIHLTEAYQDLREKKK